MAKIEMNLKVKILNIDYTDASKNDIVYELYVQGKSVGDFQFKSILNNFDDIETEISIYFKEKFKDYYSVEDVRKFGVDVDG
jgi:hypothetical protein